MKYVYQIGSIGRLVFPLLMIGLLSLNNITAKSDEQPSKDTDFAAFSLPNKGASWLYQRGQSKIKLAVTSQSRDGNKLTSKISLVTGNKSELAKVIEITKDGLYEERAGTKGSLCLMKLPYREGQIWNSQYVDAKEKKWTVESKAMPKEVIRLPSGTFNAVPVLSTYKSDTSTLEFKSWYANGVGLIQFAIGEDVVEYLISLEKSPTLPK